MTGLSDSAARKSGLDPRPWEIWLAYVRFADHPDVGKVRPIVIIDERVSAIVAAKVTTAAPQKRFLLRAHRLAGRGSVAPIARPDSAALPSLACRRVARYSPGDAD